MAKKILVDFDMDDALIKNISAGSAAGEVIEFSQYTSGLAAKQDNMSIASGNPLTISSDEISLDLLSADKTLTLSNLNTSSLEVTLEREDAVFGTVSGSSTGSGARTFAVNTSYNIYFYVQSGNPVIVAYNTTASQWEVFKILGGDSPADWSAGALSGTIVGPEDLTSSSETLNGKNSPASSDAQVAYSDVDSSYLTKSANGLAVDVETTLAGAAGKIADAAAVKTYVDEIDTNVNDLITLSGVAENASNLGTFTGSTIADNTTVKAALQALETEAEANNLTVAAGSSSLLSISGNEISVSSLLLTSVTVNTAATDLADYITDNASEFAGLEEGDILIMTGATDQTKRSYIHNGGTAGTSADMTRMQVDLNVNTIRAMLAGTANEIDYNSTTGVFSFNASAAENIAPTSHSFTAVSSPSSLQDFMEKADVLLAGLAAGTGFSAGAVDTAAIADDAIEADALSSSCVTSAAIATNAVTSAAVADDAITTDAVADASITLAKMAANSVDSDQYVDGSIDTAHLSTGAVTHAKLGADCVDGDNIQDDVINSEHIAAGAVDLEHMSANSVDSDQYVDGSIDLVHMSANSVDSDQYVDGSIDNVHIADGTITAAKLADDYMVRVLATATWTAGEAKVVTHNLGSKYVHVTVFDDSDNIVVPDVVGTSTSTATVTISVAGDYSVVISG